MPREVYLVGPAPVSLPDLVRAGAAVDDQLQLRALNEGAAVQLVDASGPAVLTIDNSRLLESTADAARVTRSLDIPAEPSWYTEISCPWGALGATGVAIASKLAELTGSSIRVEEGL